MGPSRERRQRASDVYVESGGFDIDVNPFRPHISKYSREVLVSQCFASACRVARLFWLRVRKDKYMYLLQDVSLAGDWRMGVACSLDLL
jgi:hypothetical protein